MKRAFDIVVAIVLMIIFIIPMFIIAIVVKATSVGPPLFWSDRVGINNCIFKMPKFRTMFINAPDVATHLLKNPDSYVTPIGSYLRKFSLDELPQIWSIITGDMSLVGPRPALHNQNDLIKLRTERGIHCLVPGITGWAQVNGRDSIPIPVKVELEEYYLMHRSFRFDLKILWMTFLKLLKPEDIQH